MYAASMMAEGVRYSIGYNALADIYRGLREFTINPSLQMDLPWHYIHTWAAVYFQSKIHTRCDPVHRIFSKTGTPLMGLFMTKDGLLIRTDPFEDRLVLRDPVSITWRPYGDRLKGDGVPKVDDGGLDTLDRLRMSYIRPSVLPLRVGCRWYLEPYYPYRFGRQFGFDQPPVPLPLGWAVTPRITRELKDIRQAWLNLVFGPTGNPLPLTACIISSFQVF